MAIISTTPFTGQMPGTSGLRKRVSVFAQQHYLENYLQAVFECLPPHENNLLVVGGDGRFHNDVALKTVLRMAAAHGFGRCIVGRNGLLSTPAISYLVRKHGARAAIVLTASHNPGGVNGDFGVKLNLPNGGPASEKMVQRIYEKTVGIRTYAIADTGAPALNRVGVTSLDGMAIEIVDPAADYLALMQRLVDFDAIAMLAKSGFSLLYDGLHGVTGPYAKAIFVETLGFPPSSLTGCTPLPDFGGQIPDPNPDCAGRFHLAMMGEHSADFGAACDSDGDRHMIMGRKIYVTPSDSLALLAQHMQVAPAYAGGLAGVARSIGTSTAVDRVAHSLGVQCYETPTGWRYFGNLLESGRISLCGEESSGASSHHIREKDGIWAVLLWLNILARTKKSVAQLLNEHWMRFGRTYYERRDYEEVDEGPCITLLSKLRGRLGGLTGRSTTLGPILFANEFSYHDVVDDSVSHQQGIQLRFGAGARLVVRLSGTGTSGATLRLYGERYDGTRFDRSRSEFLESLFDLADQIMGVSALTRRFEPTLVT